MKIIIALSLLFAATIRAADDPESACRSHLRNLGGAIKAYALLHDKNPTKLSELHQEGLIEKLSDFVCPASGIEITIATEIDAKSDYTFEALPGAKDMLVREKTPRHGSTVLAIFSDGSFKALEIGGAAVAKSVPSAGTGSGTPAIDPKRVTPAIPDTASDGPVVQRDTPRKQPDGETPQPALENAENSRRSGSPNVNQEIKVVEQEPGARTAMSADMGFGFGYDRNGRLLVTAVHPSLGSMLGVSIGDQVTELENQPVPKGREGPVSLGELARLSRVSPGDDIIVGIRHSNGGESTVAIPTPGGEPPAVQLIPPGTDRTQQRAAPPAPKLGGQARRPYIGAFFQDQIGGSSGARIAEVARQTPAEAAGLKSGDVVMAVDGEPVENSQHVAALVGRKSAGDAVSLLVVRSGKTIRINVVLAAQPAT